MGCGVEDGSDLAVGIALEFEGLAAFQEADELVGSEDGAQFDVVTLGDDLETLTGLEA